MTKCNLIKHISLVFTEQTIQMVTSKKDGAYFIKIYIEFANFFSLF